MRYIWCNPFNRRILSNLEGKRKGTEIKNPMLSKGPLPAKTIKGGMKEKKKSLFPCMIFGEDHPTHQCPRKDEINRYLA
jgi:hypothetical protein